MVIINIYIYIKDATISEQPMVIINKFIYKRRDYIRATNGYYK